MRKTDTLRRQHKDLLEIAAEISSHLNSDKLSKDANEVRSLLSQLFGKLNVHLTLEDQVLYPQLINHSDEKIKETAKRFVDQMGGIADALKDYKNKWSNAIKIQKAADDFINDTKGIFDALAKRIEKENNELYVLLDIS